MKSEWISTHPPEGTHRCLRSNHSGFKSDLCDFGTALDKSWSLEGNPPSPPFLSYISVCLKLKQSQRQGLECHGWSTEHSQEKVHEGCWFHRQLCSRNCPTKSVLPWAFYAPKPVSQWLQTAWGGEGNVCNPVKRKAAQLFADHSAAGRGRLQQLVRDPTATIFCWYLLFTSAMLETKHWGTSE